MTLEGEQIERFFCSHRTNGSNTNKIWITPASPAVFTQTTEYVISHCLHISSHDFVCNSHFSHDPPVNAYAKVSLLTPQESVHLRLLPERQSTKEPMLSGQVRDLTH